MLATNISLPDAGSSSSSSNNSKQRSTVDLYFFFFPSTSILAKAVTASPMRIPNQQHTLNKLPTELQCRNFVNKHQLTIPVQIGVKRAKTCSNVQLSFHFAHHPWWLGQIFFQPVNACLQISRFDCSHFCSLSLSLSYSLTQKKEASAAKIGWRKSRQKKKSILKKQLLCFRGGGERDEEKRRR